MIRSSLFRRASIRLIQGSDSVSRDCRDDEPAWAGTRRVKSTPLDPLITWPTSKNTTRAANRQRRGNAQAVRDNARRGATGCEVLLSLVITAKLVGRIRPAATRAVAVSCRGCCRGEHRGARIKLGALVPGLKTSVEAIIFRAVHTRRARPQGKEHEQNQYCFPPLSPSLSPCRG